MATHPMRFSLREKKAGSFISPTVGRELEQALIFCLLISCAAANDGVMAAADAARAARFEHGEEVR